MKKEIRGNKNYAAYTVTLDNKIELEGCDNICGTMIYNTHVIISKDTQIGDIGIYFPVECQLSEEYLSKNNLFRDAELNEDTTKKGFFEKNRRIKAVKMRGYVSDGLFMPLSSLSYLGGSHADFLTMGEAFDTIDGKEICRKYVVKLGRTPSDSNKSNKMNKKLLRHSKLIEGQMRLHVDTEQLATNLFKIKPDSIISITKKLHGCISGDSIVNTLEAGDTTIADIVNNKLNYHIKSFDIDNNEVVYSKISDFYLKKDDGDWYEIELNNGIKLQITKDHPVWLPLLGCYRKVSDLTNEDILLID